MTWLRTSISIALPLALAPTMAMARPIPVNNREPGKSFQMAQYQPPANLGKPPTTGGGTRGTLKCDRDRELP
ncbi:MAG: hypothetical protein F6K35_39530, partial [Okeania sp. SIO2H7]|nr:hypothetical protein [Okeania sp. SIO2H7]